MTQGPEQAPTGGEQLPNVDSLIEQEQQRHADLSQRVERIEELIEKASQLNELRRQNTELESRLATAEARLASLLDVGTESRAEELMDDAVSDRGRTVIADDVDVRRREPRTQVMSQDEKKESFWAKNKRKIGTAAAIGLVAAGSFIGLKSCGGDDSEKVNTTNNIEKNDAQVDVANDPVKVKGPAGNPEADSDQDKKNNQLSGKIVNGKLTITKAELKKIYGNEDDGSDRAGLVGDMNIVKGNPEATKRSLFEGIRHNPQTLGELKTVFELNNPSYANATTVDSMDRMNWLANFYADPDNMTAKANAAEKLIKEINSDWKVSYTTHSGDYKTIITKNDGTMLPGVNNRQNDLWMVLTNKETGDVVRIRDCEQIVARIPGSPETPGVPSTPGTPETPDTPDTPDKPPYNPPENPPYNPPTPPSVPDKDPSLQPPSEGGPGAGGSPEEGMDPGNDSNDDGYGPGDTVPEPDPAPAPTPEPAPTPQPTPEVVVPAPVPEIPPANNGGPSQPSN